MEKTKRFWASSLLIALFTVLMTFSFVACSNKSQSSGVASQTDHVKFELTSSTESGSTTTNKYKVTWYGKAAEQPTKYKVVLRPYSEGDGWAEFKKYKDKKVTIGSDSNVDYSDSAVWSREITDASPATITATIQAKDGATTKTYTMVWEFAKMGLPESK